MVKLDPSSDAQIPDKKDVPALILLSAGFGSAGSFSLTGCRGRDDALGGNGDGSRGDRMWSSRCLAGIQEGCGPAESPFGTACKRVSTRLQDRPELRSGLRNTAGMSKAIQTPEKSGGGVLVLSVGFLLIASERDLRTDQFHEIWRQTLTHLSQTYAVQYTRCRDRTSAASMSAEGTMSAVHPRSPKSLTARPVMFQDCEYDPCVARLAASSIKPKETVSGRLRWYG